MSELARIAVQAFRAQEQARLRLDRLEKKARIEAARYIKDDDDLAWYHAETQKIIDEFDVKRAAEGLE